MSPSLDPAVIIQTSSDYVCLMNDFSGHLTTALAKGTSPPCRIKCVPGQAGFILGFAEYCRD